MRLSHARRARDDQARGAALADFVRRNGPLSGTALHRLAWACAAAMARLHARGTAGLRLGPQTVALGTRGQVLIGWEGAATVRDDRAMSEDMRDWADLVVFAATGSRRGDPDVLPPVLRTAVERCRHPDPEVRPAAAHVLRALLGHSMATAVASVDDLLACHER
ncbi:hypothetical protein [Nonomuraea sp. SYSU D8015]|uniref:hypothetical protein n=1 Tax=Nonomuraea sp. SYSU D8015 TaxID=2593644 RepID=UPI00166119BB|nr:hypothetical protein [Nonomuraea sp. SYSU D8015]